MKKQSIEERWAHSHGLSLTDTRRVKRACLPLVEDIVTALMNQGLDKTGACKAVRWATHVIEGR